MRGMPDKNGEIQDKILDIRQVFLYSIWTRRRIEQLAARRAHNPEVVGSSPTPANRPVRFPVSAFFVLLLTLILSIIIDTKSVFMVEPYSIYKRSNGIYYVRFSYSPKCQFLLGL